MILKLINNTAVAKSYASGAVTLAGTIGATVLVSVANQLATSVDGNLFSDVSQNNVSVSDNVNTFIVSDGLIYLDRIVRTAGGLYDSNGVPLSTDNGQLLTQDTINVSFTAGIIVVGTTPVQVKVGGVPLVNRKYARIQPLNGIVYQGSSNAITSSSGSGKVALGQIEIKGLTDNAANWYIVAATGSVNVYIEEGS